jgi:glycosyltransferase involved in cell wall biosynthesis
MMEKATSMTMEAAGASLARILPDGCPCEVTAHERIVFSERRSRWLTMIPVWNEGERIRGQLRAIAAGGFGTDVIVVDFGSTDGSLDDVFLREVGVRCLLRKTGPGRLSSQMRIGFAWALEEGYDGVVTVDGNGKDGVEALPLMLGALASGFDFVQGSRYVHGGLAENTPMERHLAVTLLHAPLISLAARRRFTDTTNGFRAHSARLLASADMALFRETFSTYNLHYYMSIRSARLGFRTCEVPVRRSYPANAPPPSKISGLSGKLGLLRELFLACLGRYDPPGKLGSERVVGGVGR